jgi:hypothetical protein
MRYQCMKRWKMLTVPTGSIRIARGQSLAPVAACSLSNCSLRGRGGEEVSAVRVGIGGVDGVAGDDTEVSQLYGHLVNDRHRGDQCCVWMFCC